jgi:hypothetical protein
MLRGFHQNQSLCITFRRVNVGNHLLESQSGGPPTVSYLRLLIENIRIWRLSPLIPHPRTPNDVAMSDALNNLAFVYNEFVTQRNLYGIFQFRWGMIIIVLAANTKTISRELETSIFEVFTTAFVNLCTFFCFLSFF